MNLPANCLTPALLIYPDLVDQNIRTTIEFLDGDPNRWRPHLKTSKLSSTMQRLVGHGVNQCKCATTLELKAACEAGFQDVLLAHLPLNANAERVKQLAARYSRKRIAVLAESPEHLHPWRGADVGIFLDIQPRGMHRTGIPVDQHTLVGSMIDRIRDFGINFRGLHYYEGHVDPNAAREGYGDLMGLLDFLYEKDLTVDEVITSGTPTFLAAKAYAGFESLHFIHRVSPGTVVYCDRRSLALLPSNCGYRSAAVVASTVVSSSGSDHLTCDAGHKTVSADAGIPTCEVVGWPGLLPLAPSEEHLPIKVQDPACRPAIGDAIFLQPTHICPTVNNFDHAWLVGDAFTFKLDDVTARGHEATL